MKKISIHFWVISAISVPCAFGTLIALNTLLERLSLKTIFGRSFPYWIFIVIGFAVLFWFLLREVCKKSAGIFLFLKKNAKIITLLIAVSCIFYCLTIFTQIGLNFRYISDDFRNMYLIREQGIPSYFWSIYQDWSGRFSQVLILALFSLLDEKLSSAIMILCTIGLSSYGIYNIVFSVVAQEDKKNSLRFASLILALMLTFMLILSAENIFTSWYWISSATSYAIGTATLLLLSGLLIKLTICPGKFWWGDAIFASLVGVITIGCSEMSATVALFFAGFFLLFQIHLQKQNGRTKLIFAFFLLAITVLFIYLSFNSPGNLQRVTFSKQSLSESVIFAIERIITQGILYFSAVHSVFLAVILLTGFLFGQFVPINAVQKQRLVFLAGTFFIAAISSIIINAFVMQMPVRAYALLNALLGMSLAFVGVYCGALFFTPRSIPTRYTLCLMLCVCVTFCVRSVYLQNFDSLEMFTKESDFRIQNLLVADKSANIVPTCTVDYFFGEIEDVRSKRGYFWVNQGLANLYGLNYVDSVGRCKDVINGKIKMDTP